MRHFLLLLWLCIFNFNALVFANNIAISNVNTTGQNTAAGINNPMNYTMIQFDLSWDNSWRTSSGSSNWDAAWVFVKFMVGVSDPTYTNVTLTTGTNTVTLPNVNNLRVGMPVFKSSGGSSLASNTVVTAINPSTNVVTLSANVSTTASNNTLVFRRIWEHASLDATAGNHTAPSGSIISVPSDGTGVFIYRNADGTGNVSYPNVQLLWQYGMNDVEDNAAIQVKVFAIEMVYVPQGSFAVGGSGGFTLTTINTANATTAPSGTGSLGGKAGGYPEGQTAPVNASWPNGFGAFYCMKYEISQGDYRDFLNTLTYNQQVSRTMSNPPNSISGTVVLGGSNRNGVAIQTSGVAASLFPAVYACNLTPAAPLNHTDDGEWIACNFLSWMDGCAYMDWAGLRPMTELEYEKACRGDQAPVANEYAWGSTSITGATGISNGGANNETFSNAGANCVFDGNAGVPGPLRVGAFAGGATTRDQAGATYYGIMEMSGNLWERPVTIEHAEGRKFSGVHGDGRLSVNGHANQIDWPELNASGEVTGVNGAGVRGGAQNQPSIYAQVSNRTLASYPLPGRDGSYGFRGVRGP